MQEETEFYTNVQLPDGSWVSALKDEFEIINNVIVRKPIIDEEVQDA